LIVKDFIELSEIPVEDKPEESKESEKVDKSEKKPAKATKKD
jgi:hypothetical protein